MHTFSRKLMLPCGSPSSLLPWFAFSRFQLRTLRDAHAIVTGGLGLEGATRSPP